MSLVLWEAQFGDFANTAQAPPPPFSLSIYIVYIYCVGGPVRRLRKHGAGTRPASSPKSKTPQARHRHTPPGRGCRDRRAAAASRARGQRLREHRTGPRSRPNPCAGTCAGSAVRGGAVFVGTLGAVFVGTLGARRAGTLGAKGRDTGRSQGRDTGRQAAEQPRRRACHAGFGLRRPRPRTSEDSSESSRPSPLIRVLSSESAGKALLALLVTYVRASTPPTSSESLPCPHHPARATGRR